MKNQVITVETVELNRQMQETIVPQTAICLEETIYEEIAKKVIRTWTPASGKLYEHKEYKLSEDFQFLFRNWHRVQNAKRQKNLNTTDRYSGRKCYLILLGDEKIIIDEEEIVGRECPKS